MNHRPRVQVLQRLGQLIQNKTDMHVLENPLRNDVVQIRLHKLKQKVYILVVIRPNRFVQFDYVRVVQLLQDLDLTVGALRIRRVLERVEDFLQSENTLG